MREIPQKVGFPGPVMTYSVGPLLDMGRYLPCDVGVGDAEVTESSFPAESGGPISVDVFGGPGVVL